VDTPPIPASASPGAAGFTLTVNGTDFAPGSVVNWNGSPRATAFVNSSQVTAAILASDVGAASTASITVANPAPGGGVSNVLFFQVTTPVPNAPFTPAASSTAGTTLYSIATGDLNGDGKLDLVIGGTAAMSLLGNGDGTFQTPQPLVTASYPICVAIADFNNDGKMDIATCSYNDPNGDIVSILLGNGDGTFQPYRSYPTDFGGRAIAAGDFNRDGKLDLAIASNNTGNVSILLGNGDGSFQPPIDIFVSPELSAVVTGDLNRDGNLDLVVANSGGTWILLGEGDGSFQPPASIPGSNAPGFGMPLLADLTGDGILDVLTLTGSGEVSVLLGHGDGTFSAGVADQGPSPRKPNSLGAISLLAGNGDGTFGPAVSTSVPWVPGCWRPETSTAMGSWISQRSPPITPR
jgi:hypothetical protein